MLFCCRSTMDPTALNDMLKGLLMKDLRVQCRARGVTPAGGREALIERLRDNMLETQDLCVLPLPTALLLLQDPCMPPVGGKVTHQCASAPHHQHSLDALTDPWKRGQAAL